MPQKIHIGKNGPAPCHASKRPCRLGQHYDSYEEADKVFDAQQSRENNTLKGVSKKPPVKKEESILTVSSYGTKKWKNDKGKLHRVDGPAVEYSNGTKKWYQNDKFHRVDGPALELANGDKEWYQNGKLHRIDGPAIEKRDGTKMWYQNGERHRTDGPAIEYGNGYRAWYQNGELHRVDGPAEELVDGTKRWYQNGKVHRVDGPAAENADGTKMWYQNGVRTRTDGPAVEAATGDKEYWINGVRHRVDGPAIEYADGSKEYWLNGCQMKEEEFNQQCGKNDDKKAQLSSETNSLNGVGKKAFVKKEESILTVNKWGTKIWKNKEGKLHRIDGPAIEMANGTKEWYRNGKLHRVDGPAKNSLMEISAGI